MFSELKTFIYFSTVGISRQCLS